MMLGFVPQHQPTIRSKHLVMVDSVHPTFKDVILGRSPINQILDIRFGFGFLFYDFTFKFLIACTRAALTFSAISLPLASGNDFAIWPASIV